VNDTIRERDPWRIPALILWIGFFLIGLAPEYVYFWLREASGVLPQHALVNSHHLITLGLACYLGLFCYHRCIEAGLSSRAAQDRGIQLAVVGLVAFLSVDFRLLLAAYMSPMFKYRVTVYLIGISKLVAWWSLMTLIIRYYAFRDGRIFAAIPSLFPSARREPPEGDSASQAPGEVSERDRQDEETPV